jgi:SAM-dependent methyltransferase
MISWAIRYRPILDELVRRCPSAVLEVGSGPEGLAMFWLGLVAGVDVSYQRRPLHCATRASALALPFPDRSWPTVVSCDMLEHMPPALRRQAVQEMARVCEQFLVIAVPSGPAARACYARLSRQFPSHRIPWLGEHMRYGLPDADEVAALLDDRDWQVRIRWHESAVAHGILESLEVRWPFKVLSYAVMRVAGPWLAARWPVIDAMPRLRAFIYADRMARS